MQADYWSGVFGEKSEELLALGARSFAELQLLLPVVTHWNAPMHVDSPSYPECILEKGCDDEGEGLEERSVAYFICAVMGLLRMNDARIQCEPGGRLMVVRSI